MKLEVGATAEHGGASLPAWGAWIETNSFHNFAILVCRSPRGERGLKLDFKELSEIVEWSLPAWGAWIETPTCVPILTQPPRRSPRGERGLKQFLCLIHHRDVCRSPRGERGLKLQTFKKAVLQNRRSPRGERGLKLQTFKKAVLQNGRSPRGERGLKQVPGPQRSPSARSLSAWGAWIEFE